MHQAKNLINCKFKIILGIQKLNSKLKNVKIRIVGYAAKTLDDRGTKHRPMTLKIEKERLYFGQCEKKDCRKEIGKEWAHHKIG